jgi:hypothetical protein
MAGLLIIPEEASFPVREEFADEPDPLSMEFVEIAAEAIREPGHASGIVPLLIRVPSDVAEKIRHIDFTLKIDEKVIERRNSAITRLANKLDIPAEILTGLAEVNHWTAWQLDEGALKTHIAPMAELICHCLTVGYLQPRLAASGESDISQWVVWYDMSELAIRPDKSKTAVDAYDRFEIDGEALRRESGFDEDDKPSGEELKIQALKALIRANPGVGAQALDALVGTPVFGALVEAPEAPNGPGAGRPPNPTGAEPQPNTPGPPAKPGEARSPTESKGKREPAKAADRSVQLAKVLAQSKVMHAIRFSGTRPPALLHPPLCSENAYGCPFTHAAEEAHLTRLATGTYESHLDSFGRLTIGQPSPGIDISEWIRTDTTILDRKGRANGSRVKV